MATTTRVYSVEASQRSHELAQIRDQKAQTERLLEDSQARNQRLMERVTEVGSIIVRKSKEIVELNHRIVELEHKLTESTLREQHSQQLAVELESEVSHKVREINGLWRRISELEVQLVNQSIELEEFKRVQPVTLVKLNIPKEIPNEIRVLDEQACDQLEYDGLEEPVVNYGTPPRGLFKEKLDTEPFEFYPCKLDSVPLENTTSLPNLELVHADSLDLHDILPNHMEECNPLPNENGLKLGKTQTSQAGTFWEKNPLALTTISHSRPRLSLLPFCRFFSNG